MRKGILLALGMCIFATPTLSAQAPLPVPVDSSVKTESSSPVPTSVLPQVQVPSAPATSNSAPTTSNSAATSDSAPVASFTNGGQWQPYRIWASAGYMMGWLKNAPLPVPLVTTGNPNDSDPGAIGQPGTQVLLGNSTVDFGTFSGFRATLGGWLDPEATIGIEGGGFVLERRTSNFFATSDSSGNPLLAFPFFNQTPTFVGEDALRISDPRALIGQFGGNVLVASSIQLWGAEINSAFCLYRSQSVEFTLLAGFRYAELQESLRIANTTTDELTDPTVTILNDSFDTRNQFYGGQIGGRLSLAGQHLCLDVTGTVALGCNHEVIDIQGSTVESGPFAATPGTFPGGFFTEPSNLGHYTRNQFTVLPTANVKLSYRLTQYGSLFAAYDVFYWNQVVRPGNQIDRNINLNQNTPLGFGGVPGGPASPAPLFNRTDFWAQGVTFGFELRF